MAITRVQTKFGDSAGADPASATFDSTPAEDNLLLAIAGERSGNSEADYTITGSGWTKRIGRDVELGVGPYRRNLAVWSKVAGASEPTNIQVDNGTTSDKWLHILEFNDSEGGTWTFKEAASNDNGQTADATSLATGTTASVPAGNLLIVPVWCHKVDNIGVDDPTITWTSAGNPDSPTGLADFDMFPASGFETDTAGGTYSDTGTIATETDNNGLTAGILVFDAVGAAATSLPPIRRSFNHMLVR